MTGVKIAENGNIIGEVKLLDGRTAECGGYIQPNSLHYDDDKGDVRDIWIPTGRYEEAHEYYIQQNWDELAKFEDWTGAEYQQYSEKDYALGRERVKRHLEQESKEQEAAEESESER
ncbi:hypothetical protein BR93DRAFT_940354 [Coniochaeta sp. PMI_546]|nr:hypothetical protein BR93DRAFT_940354 [Coniochaeta sp. PMI_546]